MRSAMEGFNNYGFEKEPAMENTKSLLKRPIIDCPI